MAAIVATDVLWKYSVTSGAAGNANAGTPNASLGKYISTTQWLGGAANDLFDDISGAENAASTVDYRCIFLHNTNANNALANAVLYISAEVAGGATISIGADTTAPSTLASTPAQALTIANETTAPAGVTFTSPTTAATGIALGSIPSGSVKAFWVKRTATNSVALSGDGVTLAWSGDTGSL